MKTIVHPSGAVAERSGDKPGLTRLRRIAQPGRKLTVDRSGNGAIRGLSAITTGEALGHDFEVDDQTVAQISGALGGVPGRWTHGGMSDDGLARHLGNWVTRGVEKFDLCRGCSLEAPLPPEGGQAVCPGCSRFMEHGLRAIGDFVFSASAHSIKPDGLDVPAPVYLMDRAEEDPRTLGISVVAHFDYDEQPVLADDGKTVERIRRFARLKKVSRALARADFVADPAANPLGLHAGTGTISELTEEASMRLDEIVDRLGAEKARTRALSFLDRYFASRRTDMADIEGVLSETEPKSIEALAAAKKAGKKKAAKVVDESEDDEDDKDGGDDEDKEGEDDDEDLGNQTCPSCGKKFQGLSAELARAVALNDTLRTKYAAARLSEAKRRSSEAGAPIDADTAAAVTKLFMKGDDESEALGEHMLRLAAGRGDTKPKPFAQLANPGLKKASDAEPDKALQEQMLSQMGYERTPDGELRKKK